MPLHDALHDFFTAPIDTRGTQRQIKLYVPQADGRMQWLSGWASKVLGWPMGKRDGVKVDGCGMDMCFHLVNCVMSAIGIPSVQWQKQYRIETL